jgi:hypothetical protein
MTSVPPSVMALVVGIEPVVAPAPSVSVSPVAMMVEPL